MQDLVGKVVVVTGGNAGIGLGLARGVARAGAQVAVWGRNQARNETACRELKSLGADSVAVACDVSREEQVAEAFDRTLATFGRVDAMFANAGISGEARFVDMSLAEWHRVLGVNLDGAFLCLREAARHMVARGDGGSLVVVSSTAAIHGPPRQQHYAASKSGVLGLMRALAVELARDGIRCNALLPGWTDTDLLTGAKTNAKFVEATTRRTPVRRWAGIEEFEKVAAFLADPGLTFHTGDSMVVDGGYTIF
jgi:NAD(P)-dependent dehydrogenase (short-subunit alcohol dehydrogenase family)